MKKNIICSFVLLAGLWSCGADTDMEQFTMNEPETLASYDYLKDYDVLKSYSSDVGVIIPLQSFMAKGMEYRIAVSNFAELLPDSLFSHGKCIKANGTVETTGINDVKEVANPLGIRLIAAPMIWHRQQNATYLNSQLSPNVIRPEGDDGGYCLKMTNNAMCSNISDAQVIHTFAKTPRVEPGISYKLKMMVRGTAEGTIQVRTYSSGKGSKFTPDVTVTKDWKKVEIINTMASGIKGLTSILFYVGNYVGTLYVDDIELVEWNDSRQKEVGKNLNTVNSNLDNAEQTAASIDIQANEQGTLEDVVCSALGEGYDPLATYIEKTDEEKQTIITAEMKRYISSVMEAGGDCVKDWFVVRDPLEPVTDDGSLFFWQQYLGDVDYAVTAFKEAAQHTDGRLYIEESELAKVGQLVSYVSSVEAKGARIDGIAIKIEVDVENVNIESIVQAFKSLGATGKYIRISDLIVRIGVTSDEVSETQLQQQAKLLSDILQAYYSNVPEAQRGGVILHQTLDSDQPLGLWDSNYQRKHAYGSVASELK